MNEEEGILDRPIAEHYASLEDFVSLSSFQQKGRLVNFIAVVNSFSEIKQTKGDDLSRSMVVCDPSAALPQNGVLVQFYKPSRQDLPQPVSGSVILFLKFKLFDYRGAFQAWTNHESKWVIFDANGSDIVSKSHLDIPPMTPQITTYVKRLAGWWKLRTGQALSTEVVTAGSLHSKPSRPRGRLTRTLQDIREGMYSDVYGLVVKTFPTRDNCFTVYLTDYTSNPAFYDYVYGDGKWSGPFGQKTMQITLWDSHARWASGNLVEGIFIYLTNVFAKRSLGGTLEGAVHGDKQYPTKVNVILIGQDDTNVKNINVRRAQYESAWKLRREEIDTEFRLQQQANRARQITPPPSTNPNLSTSYEQVPITAIGDILSPPFASLDEHREAMRGRKPLRYRTTGRIVDFWPPDLRAFCKPYCLECQATSETMSKRYYEKCACRLKNDEHESTCESQRLRKDGLACGHAQESDKHQRFEWAFTVLLEGQDCVCMPVIFFGEDAEVLLGDDIVPCDLYKPQNVVMLNKLRERLFLLWGTLEESFNAPLVTKKSKKRKNERVTVEESLMWNHFCVKEYWCDPRDVIGGRDKAGWQGRRFRGFGMALI